MAQAGLVLSFFMFMFFAVVAFFSDASVLVVVLLCVCAALTLWAAMFASQKVALILGRVFPLG